MEVANELMVRGIVVGVFEENCWIVGSRASGEAICIDPGDQADDILEQVRDFDPHMVILDLAMPGKSGWEAAKELRACLPGKRLVLVALTGEHTRGADRDSSRMSGFDFHLMKPCDPNVLLTLLRWVRIDSPYRSHIR